MLNLLSDWTVVCFQFNLRNICLESIIQPFHHISTVQVSQAELVNFVMANSQKRTLAK